MSLIINTAIEDALLPTYNKRTILLKTCRHYMRYSTTHGFPNIAISDSWIVTIMWVMCFSAGLAGTIYYTTLSIQAYLAYGVNVALDRVQESPSTFPAVTICNLQAFDASKPQVVDELNALLSASGSQSTINSSSNASSMIDQVNAAFGYLKTKVRANVSSLAPRYGFDLNSILISCFFDGQSCNASDFTPFYLYDYVNCFVFNNRQPSDAAANKSLRTVSLAGNGLHLELFAGDSSLPGYLPSVERGFFVAVHNNSDSANKWQGVKVPVTYAGDIGVRRTFHYKLEVAGCRQNTSEIRDDDSLLYRVAASQPNTLYSMRLCYEACLQNAIELSCGCSKSSLVKVNQSLAYCLTASDNQCALVQSTLFADTSFIADQCSSLCPLECNSVNYLLTSSRAFYPTRFYFNLLMQQEDMKTRFANYTYGRFRNRVTQLDITYASMKYIVATESLACDMTCTINNIGAYVGLFIGSSVLSLFEIGELIIDLISKFYKRHKMLKRAAASAAQAAPTS